jgi:hypothetical protein
MLLAARLRVLVRKVKRKRSRNLALSGNLPAPLVHLHLRLIRGHLAVQLIPTVLCLELRLLPVRLQVAFLVQRNLRRAYLDPVSNVSTEVCAESSSFSLAPTTTTGQGTASPAYTATQERDSAVGGGSTTLHYQSITAMPAYRNFSFEVSPLGRY